MSGVAETSLPAGWRINRLDFVARVKARLGWKGLTASEYVEDGYVFLSTPNIKGRDIDFDNVNFITAERYFESPEIMLQVGDVLLAKDGSTLGTCSVVRHLPRPATVNGSIAVIRPGCEVDPVFLHYVFASPEMQARIRSFKDGMGVPHLFQSDLRKFPVFVPPLEEQRVIGGFLDDETARIDGLIDKQRRVVELLEEQRLGTVRLAVTGGGSHSLWGAAQERWRSTKLGYVCDVVGGATPDKSKSLYWAGDIPWVSPKDMKRRIIDTAEDHVCEAAVAETALRLIQPSAVLIVVRGMFLVHSFPVGLTTVPLVINQDMKALLPKPELRPQYLAWVLEGISDFMLAHVEQAAHGTCCLRTEVWRQVPLKLPSLAEQDRISADLEVKTEKISQAIHAVVTGIAKLHEYRSVLISAAVTGQIDVRNYRPQEAAAACQ
jgi:type I restriction enzyme S subunit